MQCLYPLESHRGGNSEKKSSKKKKKKSDENAIARYFRCNIVRSNSTPFAKLFAVKPKKGKVQMAP